MSVESLELALQRISEKKAQLVELRQTSSDYLKNLEEWFRVELTYNSNAIEGNTLTRSETALVIEKGITVKGKTLVEHLEAINHAEAIDHVKGLAAEVGNFTKLDLLSIHRLILSKIDDPNAGRYRTFNVAISGSNVDLPDHLAVPELMDMFFRWLRRSSKDHPVIQAADAHYRLVQVHPFVDGNGRTARLLMNLMLLQTGYPTTVIGNDRREDYITALEQAHMTGDLSDFYQLIVRSVDSSLDIHLGTKKPRGVKERRLLKIGQVARLTDLPASTIRFWTNEVLLNVAETSRGGYRWYPEDAIARVGHIQKLKAKRLTLPEIKRELDNQ